MKKTKLDLGSIKIQSFVTSYKEPSQQQIRGAGTFDKLDCTVYNCNCPTENGCNGGSNQCGSNTCTQGRITCLVPC